MLLFKLFDRGLGFISTVVLARVLTPADFGLVAMAMSVVALIELAGAFSLEVALIQRKAPSRAHYDTTWTLRLMFGVFCALTTAAMALPAAAFYADPRLTPILFLLAAGWLVESTENVGTVDFRRDLNFKKEFIFLATKRVIGVAVTLSIALLYQTYWALIAGTLVGRAVGVILSYVMHPYRPRFDLTMWRELMAFSGWLFATNFFWFINSRLSHFVIGRTQGAGALGIFTVANDVAALASNEITMPINRAVMPGLSRMAEEENGLSVGLLKVISVVMLIALPAALGLTAVAEPLVLSLLGPKWIEAVPAVQVLAFAGAMQSLTASNQSAYLASGRSHVPAISQLVWVGVLIPLLMWLHDQNVVGIAWAQCGATAAATCVSVVLMRHYLGVPLGALFKAIARPLVAAVVMAMAVATLDTLHFGWAADLGAVARLLLGVGAGIVIYVALVGALWFLAGLPPGAERLVFERLRRGRV